MSPDRQVTNAFKLDDRTGIPNHIMCELIEESGVALKDIALQLDWLYRSKGHEYGDASRLRRTLGILMHRTTTMPARRQTHTRFDVAERIMDIINVPWYEVEERMNLPSSPAA